MMNHTPQSMRSRLPGFALIEVLVTIIIISVGLLGFAGLQAYALKSNRIAMQRSLATMEAYNIIDSMRANRTAAVDLSAYNQNYSPVPCTNSPAHVGVVATDDLADWNAALACALPSGQGKITVAPTGVVTISMKWKEGTAAGDPFVSPWSTETNL